MECDTAIKAIKDLKPSVLISRAKKKTAKFWLKKKAAKFVAKIIALVP